MARALPGLGAALCLGLFEPLTGRLEPLAWAFEPFEADRVVADAFFFSSLVGEAIQNELLRFVNRYIKLN